MNTNVLNTNTLIAAARFHALAEKVVANGGFRISASRYNANVVAGEISRATGVSFEEARRALDVTGGEEWKDCAYAHSWPVSGRWVEGRFAARTVARAACRPVMVAE